MEHEGPPSCAHGPTLLFPREDEDLRDGSQVVTASEERPYYACSAYRDRRLCPFFAWADEWSSPAPPAPAAAQVASSPVRPPQQQQEQREATRGGVRLSENAKGLAQFMFDAAALDLLVAACTQWRAPAVDVAAGPCRVLCLGTPRLHERLLQHESRGGGGGGVESLLLDLDHRFAPFFGSTFARFNMGNGHFFDAEGRARAEAFMAAGCDCVVLDPPYGMLVSSLVATLRGLSRLVPSSSSSSSSSSQAEKTADDLGVPVMWMCPFYYEERIKASLPAFEMLDYQVGYDNHPLFSRETRSKSRQRRARHGRADGFAFSPVRIFTNAPNARARFVLPEAEGYRLCPACDRYVHRNNLHCDACGECTSKDGRKWRHCDECGLCVPPGRVHCGTCARCDLPQHAHTAGAGATDGKRSGCFTCGAMGHKKRSCPTTSSKKRKKGQTSMQQQKKMKTATLEATAESASSVPNGEDLTQDTPRDVVTGDRQLADTHAG